MSEKRNTPMNQIYEAYKSFKPNDLKQWLDDNLEELIMLERKEIEIAFNDGKFYKIRNYGPEYFEQTFKEKKCKNHEKE